MLSVRGHRPHSERGGDTGKSYERWPFGHWSIHTSRCVRPMHAFWLADDEIVWTRDLYPQISAC
jgi:hypothetical protein